MSAITNRILRELGDPELMEKLLSLPKSDLNSLLLELFQRQAGDITPHDMLKAFEANHFAQPSGADPALVRHLEAMLLMEAEAMDIQPFLLSPAAPLGSCSAFGRVNQNNVLSALRKTEVLSDPTNMLALIMAERLRHNEAQPDPLLHYAATARVTRAQAFAKKGQFPHFELYSMVSVGKARSSYICEKALLWKHLRYYKQICAQLDIPIFIKVQKRGGYADGDGFLDRMLSVIKGLLPEIEVSVLSSESQSQYYEGFNFKLFTELAQETVEIGDGGFVNWINQMLGGEKYRCLISGIGLERILPYYKRTETRRKRELSQK